MEMKQLQEAWGERQARVQRWKEKLFEGAYALRDEVTKQLKPNSAKFTDASGYLELNVVETFETGSNKMLYRMSASALSHLINEELRFSIGVYLEEPGSRVKTLALVRVAVRAASQRIEWCLWDPGQEDRGRPQAWIPNVAAVADLIVQRLVMCFEWNPMYSAEFKAGMDLLDEHVRH